LIEYLWTGRRIANGCSNIIDIELFQTVHLYQTEVLGHWPRNPPELSNPAAAALGGHYHTGTAFLPPSVLVEAPNATLVDATPSIH